MASGWLRLLLAAVLGLVPPAALAFWPAVTPAPADVHQHHAGAAAPAPDHSPQPTPQPALALPPDAPLPAGVGALSWDGVLPDWPAGGRELAVGAAAPYRTLAAALAAAEEGDHITLLGGQHPGPVSLQRRVWLEGRQGAALIGNGEDTVVRVLAPGAWITGLAIRVSGRSLNREDAGVLLERAAGAIIAGCRLEDVLFGVVAKQSPGVLITGNEISGKPIDLSLMGDGVRIWFSQESRVVANTVRGMREIIIENTEGGEVRGNAVLAGRQGVHIMNSHRIQTVGNFLSGNSTGIYNMYGAGVTIRGNWVENHRGPSGYGVGVKEADDTRIEDNRLVGNRVGIYLDNAPLRPDRPGNIARNLVAYNDLGVLLAPSTHSNLFAGNDLVENLQQVSLSGGGQSQGNTWNAGDRGNYWSDYVGFDAAGDGVGDVPYAPAHTFEGWMDRQPGLRWFWFSPAATAIEMAVRAFPAAAREPLLSDERPVIHMGDWRDAPWSCCSK